MKTMLLLFALVTGSTCAWADTSTLTFTQKCNGSGTADDGAVWTVTSDGTESVYDGTSGIHYGTNSAEVTYVQLATSDISGTITQVVVNARDAQAKATVSVTVGGTAFTCSGSATATTSSANYTFTGSGSGEIVVRVDRGSSMKKAIYVKSVAVTYTAGATVNVTGVALDQSSLSLIAGENATLTATVSPADATNKAISWESDDTDVATVSNGVVTAVAAGTATITVTTNDGSFTATCDVTVHSAPVASLSFDFSDEAWGFPAD